MSAVLGNLLPGPGSVYRAQSFNFVERVRVGSRLRIEVKCIEKREKPLALFETTVAKMRVFRVPEFAGGALMLGLLGTRLLFVSRSF